MDINKSITVEATKTFSVGVEKLFQAWNDPEQLKQWWQPMGNQLKDVTNDLKPGGTVRYSLQDNGLTISGEYEEVKENERLIYTWNWDFPDDSVKNAKYKLTVVFSGDSNSSNIHVRQENNQHEEALQPNQEGWEKGLADLAAFLHPGEKNDETAQKTGSESAEEAGYREKPEQQKVGGG